MHLNILKFNRRLPVSQLVNFDCQNRRSFENFSNETWYIKNEGLFLTIYKKILTIFF